MYHGHCARLLRVPPARLRGIAQPQPRRRRVSRRPATRATGRATRLAPGDVQSRAPSFPLVGVHSAQPCSACHRNNVYKGTARECTGVAGQTTTQTTKNPRHVAAGFPTTCETVSSGERRVVEPGGLQPRHGVPAGRRALRRSRARTVTGTTSTRGRRATATDATGRTTTTTNPKHVAAGFPTTCETCHRATDASWNRSAFNHTSVFPLVGVHATQACAACHKNGVYQGTPRDCFGCHQPPTTTRRRTPTTRPRASRPRARPATATAPCWEQGGLQPRSVFPLAGAHANAACAACHKNGVYAGTPAIASVPPGRLPARRRTRITPRPGFPTTCEDVPRAGAGWDQAASTTRSSSRSSASTRRGLHRLPQERRLRGHATGLLRLPQSDYHATTNPNHVAAGFPTACETCHGTGGPGTGAASTTRSSSRCSGATRHSRAPPATRTASTRGRRATATVATGEVRRRRRIRTTPPQASRRPARPVTGRRIRRGPRAPSTTRGSQSPADRMRATPARPVTPTRPTTRCSRAPRATDARRPTATIQASRVIDTTRWPATPATPPDGAIEPGIGAPVAGREAPGRRRLAVSVARDDLRRRRSARPPAGAASLFTPMPCGCRPPTAGPGSSPRGPRP